MPTLQPFVQLNCGIQMPLLGLGTYKMHGDQLYASVDAALRAGYRCFDTAAVYDNEADLGLALRELLPQYALTREDVFIISKLDPADHGVHAREGSLRSVDLLACGPIDLYLIHWPATKGLDDGDPQNATNRLQSWAILEGLYSSGKFRAIGISNYMPSHFSELMENCRLPPAVLQSEFHPKLCQNELRRMCDVNGVCFQAYSSLGKGALLQDVDVQTVACDLKRTPAQVLLRWAVQQGVPVLPRSQDTQRVQENACVFDFHLSSSVMERLGALDCGWRACKRDSSCIV